MTARPILPWPHPALKKAAAPVGKITDDIRTLWDDMIDTMEAMPGVGLAAPQIGYGLQLAVVDASDDRGHAVRIADPEVLDVSDTANVHPEASPNLPGVHANITRPAEVTVAFTDQTGTRVTQTFKGLWATSVQHQIDHLNGRMFFDNLSRTKRAMLLKRAGKRTR
ncbi:MAG: peptide deformylase [Pseudomonadota bacterium]